METKEIEMRLNNLEQKMEEVHKLTQILPRLEERIINQKDDVSDHERRLRNNKRIRFMLAGSKELLGLSLLRVLQL